jgi:hypothetical protein
LVHEKDPKDKGRLVRITIRERTIVILCIFGTLNGIKIHHALVKTPRRMRWEAWVRRWTKVCGAIALKKRTNVVADKEDKI